MKFFWFGLSVLVVMILFTGCTTTQAQDEEYKALVAQVVDDFDDQREMIVNPYQGATVLEMIKYRDAAKTALAASESMTLSDKYKKSQRFFAQAMNATIDMVDELEADGKLANNDEKITTESVNSLLVTIQTQLDDACDIIGVEKKRTI